MQNLRDKLLKAGKIDQRQKRGADQRSRQRRPKKRGHVAADGAEQQRQAVYAAKLAEERAENARLEAIRHAARLERAQQLQVTQLATFYAVSAGRGAQRWYYVGQNGHLQFLEIDGATAWRLEHSALAIVACPQPVEPPDGTPHTLVDAQTAERIWSIDPAYVRFWNHAHQPRPFESPPEQRAMDNPPTDR